MHFWDQHRTITRYYEIRMKEVCSKYNLRQLEYDILLFLHNNPQYKIASDIVKIRKSTKSHVSTSLDVLEKRGFIRKNVDDKNHKRMEIELLPEADEVVKAGNQVQKQFAQDVLEGIDPEEILEFKKIFEKICANAERHINQKGGQQDE